MVGVKEVCALLLAGGIGAGSVVAVQEARPQQVKAKPKASAPKVFKASQRTIRQTITQDCPSLVSSGVGLAELQPVSPTDPLQLAALDEMAIGKVPGGGLPLPPVVSGIGGGGGGGFLPEPGGSIPSVPQPASWAMMVAGFGLVGMALRKGGEGDQGAGKDAPGGGGVTETV